MKVKRLARASLDRLGLSILYYRLYEWRHSRQLTAAAAANAPDGPPLPTPYLMTLVAGGPDPDWFLASGKACADGFAQAAADAGLPFSAAKRILDFGCGCGRIIRHLPAMTAAELHGMDYNPRLVAWCQRNLAGRFSRNHLRPPLRTAADQFDVIYLKSVFTHLSIDTQRDWLAELHRVVRTGGLVLVTFHDENQPTFPRTPTANQSINTQGFYLHNAQGEGSNFMATFQTCDFSRRLFGERFEVVSIKSNDETGMGQALAVLRKRGEGQ